jgi:hypothetical protein
MKTTLGTVAAAFLLAGAAYVMPAHAQNAAQPQPDGTSAAPAQTQPYGTTGWGQTEPGTVSQPGGATTPAQTYGARSTAQPYSASNQMQSQLPQGAYLSSCKDARMDGQTLIAFCEKSDRTWQTSALRTNLCPSGGDIQNVNGDLTCGAGIGVGSSTPPAQRPY